MGEYQSCEERISRMRKCRQRAFKKFKLNVRQRNRYESTLRVKRIGR